MHSGWVLGGQAETSKRKQKHPLVSKTSKIEGMVLKFHILELFWMAGLKFLKLIKITHPGRNVEK